MLPDFVYFVRCKRHYCNCITCIRGTGRNYTVTLMSLIPNLNRRVWNSRIIIYVQAKMFLSHWTSLNRLFLPLSLSFGSYTIAIKHIHTNNVCFYTPFATLEFFHYLCKDINSYTRIIFYYPSYFKVSVLIISTLHIFVYEWWTYRQHSSDYMYIDVWNLY